MKTYYTAISIAGALLMVLGILMLFGTWLVYDELTAIQLLSQSWFWGCLLLIGLGLANFLLGSTNNEVKPTVTHTHTSRVGRSAVGSKRKDTDDRSEQSKYIDNILLSTGGTYGVTGANGGDSCYYYPPEDGCGYFPTPGDPRRRTDNGFDAYAGRDGGAPAG